MMQHIDVSNMLRQAVACDLYSNLVTRPTGAAVRAQIQALVGAGPVGAALLEQKLDGLFFTGSYATGTRIAQTIGPRFVKLQLELGGKDPTYVSDDADPKAAAESLADGAM